MKRTWMLFAVLLTLVASLALLSSVVGAGSREQSARDGFLGTLGGLPNDSARRGVGTPAPSQTLAAGDILLAEDFESIIVDWEPFLNYWRLHPEQWYLQATTGYGDSIGLRHTAFLGVVDPDDGAHDALYMYRGAGSEAWTDYRIEARIKMEAGSLMGLWVRGKYLPSAITGRHIDGYYVTWRPNRSTNSVSLRRLRNSGDYAYHFADHELLASGDRLMELDTWYHLAVEVRGSNIKVMVDGDLILEHEDATYGTGTVGLYAYQVDYATWDDIVVSSLGGRYVAPSGSDGGDCADSANPCRTVQYAVDQADSGDPIHVAQGTYTDVNTYAGLSQVAFISKTVALRGGYSPDFAAWDPDGYVTTLDAQGGGRGLYVTGPISPTLVGLRIVNGNADGLGGRYQPWNGITADVGAGLYVATSTVTIDGCEISGNRVSHNPVPGAPHLGGGMYGTSPVTLINSLISENGGDCTAGVYLEEADGALIMGNQFVDNTSTGGNCYTGGGLSVQGDDVVVEGNHFEGNDSYAGGGLGVSGSILVRANHIASNDAVYGGGIHIEDGISSLIGNEIVGNRASQAGGGISAMGGSAMLINNVIVENSVDGQVSLPCDGLDGGSAVLAFSNSTIELSHNTIARNPFMACDGNAVLVSGGAAVTMTNNILASHTLGITVTAGATATLEGTLWGSGGWANIVDWAGSGSITTGTVNVWGDPAFVDPDAGDYHIGFGSAALDAGVEAGIATDIDGQPRPQGNGYDIGADETAAICVPVSGVALSHSPAGDLFTGNLLHFAAAANGTSPFLYAWTLDGAPVGTNRSSFEHVFETAGIYAIGVVVTNACAQGSDEVSIDVQAPVPGQPDLSLSDKSVNLSSVDMGDVLTYTLILRNRSSQAAAATLIDPIPENTTYVVGSARASSGGPVTTTGDLLHWSGQVISGTPVVIEFAVQVGSAPVGTPITNTAFLDDGTGNSIELRAGSMFSPGYRLSVNEGALATSIPTVALRFAWDAGDGITHVKFSNDGGFGPGGDASGWLAVNPGDPTFSGWVLSTYGDLRLPRTVYAQFRDSAGDQYGPVQDDIIYDPDPPEVISLEVIETPAGSVAAATGQDVIVRVTVQDANSGASTIHVSHSEGFDAFSEAPVTSGTTDIPWSIQSSGEVYVRVVDRAGNLSEVSSEVVRNQFYVYLPVTLRHGP